LVQLPIPSTHNPSYKAPLKGEVRVGHDWSQVPNHNGPQLCFQTLDAPSTIMGVHIDGTMQNKFVALTAAASVALMTLHSRRAPTRCSIEELTRLPVMTSRVDRNEAMTSLPSDGMSLSMVRGYLVAASATRLILLNMTSETNFMETDNLVHRVKGAPRFVLDRTINSLDEEATLPVVPLAVQTTISRWSTTGRPSVVAIDDRQYSHAASYVVLVSSPRTGLAVYRSAVPFHEVKSDSQGFRLPFLVIGLLVFFAYTYFKKHAWANTGGRKNPDQDPERKRQEAVLKSYMGAPTNSGM
jgi:hypothetical protein